MQRHTFRAMGTTIELLLDTRWAVAAARAFQNVEREFRRLESVLSRFDPRSELSRLNHDGRLVASSDLRRVVHAALEARERTEGRFDPTVHNALRDAGYDRSFEQLGHANFDRQRRGRAPACAGQVTLDPVSGMIQLEPGTRLDLGGIGKGAAVDHACDMLGSLGPCLVNAGGDLAIRGTPTAGMWPIGVETSRDTISLGLKTGAVATSGRDRRRWRCNGEERHHLIDPSTGRPSASNLIRVTVIAGTAVEAEIRAKDLFLAGESEATRRADALKMPALLVTGDARDVWAGGLGR
jgi:FAD:protein FMN transferase